MTLAKPRPPLTPGETRAYPVLPLRDIVVFPHMIVPLFVGREKSIKALEEVMRSDTFILLARRTPPMTIRRPIPSTRPARSRACCSC
jgi:ATP-dependent Lon protease